MSDSPVSDSSTVNAVVKLLSPLVNNRPWATQLLSKEQRDAVASSLQREIASAKARRGSADAEPIQSVEYMLQQYFVSCEIGPIIQRSVLREACKVIADFKNVTI